MISVPEHQNPEMAHAYPQLIDIEILKVRFYCSWTFYGVLYVLFNSNSVLKICLREWDFVVFTDKGFFLLDCLDNEYFFERDFYTGGPYRVHAIHVCDCLLTFSVSTNVFAHAFYMQTYRPDVCSTHASRGSDCNFHF